VIVSKNLDDPREPVIPAFTIISSQSSIVSRETVDSYQDLIQDVELDQPLEASKDYLPHKDENNS
jgi:hypothetical protein